MGDDGDGDDDDDDDDDDAPPSPLASLFATNEFRTVKEEEEGVVLL